MTVVVIGGRRGETDVFQAVQQEVVRAVVVLRCRWIASFGRVGGTLR